MLDDVTIMNGLIAKNHELVQKTAEYNELLAITIEYERHYHVELHKKMLKLKADGETMAWINSVCKIDPDVADLRMKYHIADAKAKACLQAIKDCRCAIDSYRSLLAWEKATRTEL